jgi:hypothetical protein
MSVADLTSVPEVVEVDGAGLDATALLILVAKSTRFLSRGTRVAVRSGEGSVRSDLRAWAVWAGHSYDGLTVDPDGAFVARISVYAAAPRERAAPVSREPPVGAEMREV